VAVKLAEIPVLQELIDFGQKEYSVFMKILGTTLVVFPRLLGAGFFTRTNPHVPLSIYQRVVPDWDHSAISLEL
jgi:hypothetical protein